MRKKWPGLALTTATALITAAASTVALASLLYQDGFSVGLDDRHMIHYSSAIMTPAACWGLFFVLMRDRRARDQSLPRHLAQDFIDAVPDGILLTDALGTIQMTNVAAITFTGLSPLYAPGRLLYDIPLLDSAGQRLSWPSDGTVRARLGHGIFRVEAQVSVKPLPGHRGMRLVHIKNVGPEMRSNALVTEHQRELDTLADLGRMLNGVTTFEEFLTVTFARVRSELSTKAAALFTVSPDEKSLVLRATAADDPQPIEEAVCAPMTGQCLCGYAAQTGEAVYSASSVTDTAHSLNRQALPHGHIVIPLKDQKQVIGILCLYLRENEEFTSDKKRLVAGIAGETGLALTRILEHAALVESELRLESLFEHAPDGILVMGPDGIVKRANRLARRWFGEAQDMRAHPGLHEMVTTTSVPERALRITLRDTPGEERVFEVAASYATSGDVQLILRDITHVIKMEQKAIEIQKMEAIGILAAGLAHNLNNLFASLLARLDMLKSARAEGKWGEADECLSTLEAGMGEVSGIVEELLDLARPSKPMMERLNLSRIIAGQVSLIKPLLGSRIQFETRLDQDIHVVGDCSILAHAFMNLALNAIDAMPGGGTLCVSLSRNDHNEAVLTVADTGMGIDDRTLSRIFEPLFTTKPNGTGLGLSTMLAGISSLKGRVEVDSRPNLGSTFVVVLPMASELYGAGAPASGSSDRRPLKILLAEDAPVLRRFLLRGLQSRGYSTIGVGSLGELRDKSASEHPDLVLMDWNLDGETTGAIVEELHASGIPVVIMTGDPESVDIEQIPVIQKPIDWNLLEKSINCQISLRGLQR